MKTVYTVLRPEHTAPGLPRVKITLKQAEEAGNRFEIDWPDRPRLQQIETLVLPLLGPQERILDHVNVTIEHARHDMFVSTRPDLPVNHVATRIYRAGWLNAHADTEEDMEKLESSLSYIHGTAVLFSRSVWF